MPDPEPISLAEIRMSIASIKAAFAAVRDPRRDHLKRFLLSDILVLAVAGMLAGCEDWVDMEDFGEQRAEWFKAQGLFPRGCRRMTRWGGCSGCWMRWFFARVSLSGCSGRLAR